MREACSASLHLFHRLHFDDQILLAVPQLLDGLGPELAAAAAGAACSRAGGRGSHAWRTTAGLHRHAAV